MCVTHIAHNKKEQDIDPPGTSAILKVETVSKDVPYIVDYSIAGI